MNLQIVGDGAPFDERITTRVAAQGGIDDAQPVVDAAATIVAPPSAPEIVRVAGVDLLHALPGQPELRDVLPGPFAVRGTGPDAALLVFGAGVIVPHRIAAHDRLHVGSPLTIIAGDTRRVLRVAAIRPDALTGIDSSTLFVDIGTAQILFAHAGLIDRIDCTVDPAQIAAVRARLAALLPPGTRAVEPQTQSAAIAQLQSSFDVELDALGDAALIVAGCLIANAGAFGVVRRRPEIGTFRALGATRAQIFCTFIGEGALFGVAGAFAGAALGVLLAQIAVALTGGSPADVAYGPVTILRAMADGIGLAIAASVFAALDAARTPPALAMRSGSSEGRIVRSAPVLGWTVAAAAGVALGAALAGAGSIAIAALAGTAALAIPLALAATSRASAPLAMRVSPAARLAAANIGGSPVRTSVAVAALTMAIAMLAGVAVFVTSFRATVIAWSDETARADLVLRPALAAAAAPRFSPALVRRLRAVPGVAAVDASRTIEIPFRGGLVTLRSTASPTPLAISEPFAARFHLRAGDALSLPTPAGERTFIASAVFADFAHPSGALRMDTATYARFYRDPSSDEVAITAARGTDVTALRSRLIRALAPVPVDIRTTREVRAHALDGFARTFGLAYAIGWMTIAIALMGVVATLFALVIERRVDIASLRYLGMRASAVRSMVLYEAGALGGVGGAIGALLGCALAAIVVLVVERRTFGWSVAWHVPVGQIAGIWTGAILAAVIAAVSPAIVAARIRTDAALRTD